MRTRLLISILFFSLFNISCTVLTDFNENAKPKEICNNGIDDDKDGYIDCDDQDCINDSMCKVEVCDDQIDNDGDTKIDCADEDCINNSACILNNSNNVNNNTHESNCSDGIDNDGNGPYDCNDAFCHEKGECSYNCSVEDSMWTCSGSNCGSCGGLNVCSFDMFDPQFPGQVNPHCVAGVDDNSDNYGGPFEGGTCAKGSINFNNNCVVVCNFDNPPNEQCPATPFGTGYVSECKGPNVHPAFSSSNSGFLSYCILRNVDNSCNPITNSNCPGGFDCKADGEIINNGGAPEEYYYYDSYCVQPFGGELTEGDTCTSDEECNGSLTCAINNSTGSGTCRKSCLAAADCDSNLCIFPTNIPNGDFNGEMYGICELNQSY